jgi:integrase
MGSAPVIKGLHFVRKRLADGSSRWHVYAWRGGPPVMSADGARPDLTTEALESLAAARRDRDAARQPNPTTLQSLIDKWQASPEWSRLSENTKKTWGSIVRTIEGRWGKVPLAIFNDERMIEKVVDWRDARAATPRAADNGVTVLRALLKYGIQRGALRINVAEKLGKIYVNGQRAEIVWTKVDLLAFEKAAGEKDRCVYYAVLLCSVTGLRREDLARITWASVGEFAIVKKAKKTSRGRRQFATVPRIPQLDAVLTRLKDHPRAPGVDTVLVNPKGRPWNLDTLTKEVSRIAKLAGIFHVEADQAGQCDRRHKHLHDARGTFATHLMTTTDLTDAEIASIMGWSEAEVERIRRIYVDDTARQIALGKRIARGLATD